MDLDVKEYNAMTLNNKVNAIPQKTLSLTWGEYFNYLSNHRARKLAEDVNIVILNERGNETNRRTTILKSNDADGNGGYIAFCFTLGQQSGDLKLQSVHIACQYTGRPYKVRVTPTIASSKGILKALKKYVPACVTQYCEIMQRV